jgi:hypothetical protein
MSIQANGSDKYSMTFKLSATDPGFMRDRTFLVDSDILFTRGHCYCGRKIHDTQHDAIKLQDVETRIVDTRISNQSLQHPSDGQFYDYATVYKVNDHIFQCKSVVAMASAR